MAAGHDRRWVMAPSSAAQQDHECYELLLVQFPSAMSGVFSLL